jgi:hypothetical protein
LETYGTATNIVYSIHFICGGGLVGAWLLTAPVSNHTAVELDTGELLPVYTGLVEFAKK